MDKTISFDKNNDADETLISIEEAAKILGYKYGTAYKKIFIEKLITHHDGGTRDKKVYKASVLVTVDKGFSKLTLTRHSERSEESIYDLCNRSFAALRMTERGTYSRITFVHST